MDCHNRSIDTYRRPYAPGTVNPVERETITYMLVVNSKFRPVYNPNIVNLNCDQTFNKKMFTSHSSKMVGEVYNCAVKEIEPSCPSTNQGYIDNVSDFTIELQEPLVNVISLKFSSIEMNNSYYPISDYLGTNVFSIKTFTYSTPEINPDEVTETILSVPEGIYTEEQLLTAINDLFTNSVLSMIRLTGIALDWNGMNVLRTIHAVRLNPRYMKLNQLPQRRFPCRSAY